MVHTALHDLRIEELSPMLRTKAVSPVEVTQHYLERINTLDRHINAYITGLADAALADARRCESEILAGEYRGPLHGVPIALKDLYDTAEVLTTAASKIYAHRVPLKDATCVKRLRAAGAIILGKTNMHEFAFGATGDKSYFGPTHNPWNFERISGGSSSGSAAAVAAGLCAAATGSDTGGSIRIPGALCGVVGLKPTYGRVSCAGTIPVSWSLDHLGSLTKSVFDAAILLQAMAGWDAQDPVTLKAPVPNYTQNLHDGVKGLRIAVDPVYAFSELDDEVEASVKRALNVLQELGVELITVNIPRLDEAREAARIIMDSEATAYHEEFLKTRPDEYLRDGPRLRLEKGFSIRGVDYGRAQRIRWQAYRDFEAVFETSDLIVMPTCPITAPQLGQTDVHLAGDTIPVVASLIRFTRIFNFVGLPAVTVPCGFSSEGLPIGLQLIGPQLDEITVLRAAYAYERVTDWHRQKPHLPITAP